MDVGEKDILKIIESLGGKADVDTIKSKYEELPNNQSFHLWAHLRDLCKSGDIKEEAPEVYSLTEPGKERILKGNYSWEGCYDEETKKKTEKAEWV
ncbi:MAG: hypothetical protein COZ98_05560 [Candidatus Omnitrophica bacterium CG_4_8_14_3_um_filter_43_15]|nr:MAG: hypothetical protein COZ98_05560 [Candidatus Omnitrophica bacterium CG_4_8_14_3_um_filter_43_15]